MICNIIKICAGELLYEKYEEVNIARDMEFEPQKVLNTNPVDN